PLIVDCQGKVGSTFRVSRPRLPFRKPGTGPSQGEERRGMAIGTLAAFWAVSFLLVLVPGPDWAYAIAAGLRDRSVLPAVAGLLAGYVGLTAVVAAGVAGVIARSPLVLTGLTSFGAVYLLWLGITTVPRPPAPGAAADRASQSLVRRAGKGAGV